MISQRKIHISICLVFLLAIIQGKAQETVGLHLSNYLPATTIQLNPALAVDARTRLDIHLIGAASFVRNDHIFLAKQGPSLRELIAGAEAEFSESTKSGDRKAYADVSIDGPSIALVKKRSSFVLSSRYRVNTHAKGVPQSLARFVNGGFDLADQQDSIFAIDDMRVSALTWGEIGFTFGHMIKVTSEEHVNAAITVKRLFGVAKAGLHLQNARYEMSNGDLNLENFAGGYSFASEDGLNANGWGFDLGLVYRKVIDGSDDYVPFSEQNSCAKSRYRYELGISLLDVGSMTFRENASTVRYNNASGDWEGILDFDPEDLEALQAELEQQLEGDNNNFEREEIVQASLPTALSIQFDYDFDSGLHLGSVLQQNLKGANPDNTRRANLLSIVPRYERTFFEFGLPLTLYEYDRVLMGASLRLYMLTIGSDDLFAVLNGNDLYGADFYFSFRIPLYKTFACEPGAKSSRKNMIAPCWGQ